MIIDVDLVSITLEIKEVTSSGMIRLSISLRVKPKTGIPNITKYDKLLKCCREMENL